MAIRVISPVNLDEGHLVALTADGKMDETKAVIGGQVVKLVESTEAAYGGEPHIEASKSQEIQPTSTLTQPAEKQLPFQQEFSSKP